MKAITSSGTAQGRLNPLNRLAAAGLMAAGLIIVIGGCTSTADFVKQEDPILRLTDLIYQQEAETLTEISNSPFLLDDEILLQRKDVRTLWTNLAGAGLRLPEARILEAETVGPETWQAFGAAGPGEKKGLETKSFFANYVSGEAALVQLQTAQGSFLLLLDGREGEYPRISGIRGPLDE